MKYSASISVCGGGKLIKEAFVPEEKSIGKRAGYSLKTTKNRAEFIIRAEDAVALKTAMNAITSLLAVIEKTK